MRGPQKERTGRARRLRQQDNDAETVIWSELRNRRLGGYKFVRQYPIGGYFADFVCRDARLVVELDGSHHAESGYDAARDAYMTRNGWSVLRLWSHDCLKDREAIVETILAACDGRLEACDTNEVRFFPANRQIDLA